jgi:hypothetical protein
LADEILEIADDSSNDWMVRRKRDGSTYHVIDHDNIARAQLRIAARSWRLSKALPRHYGARPAPAAWNEPDDTLTALMKEIEERNRQMAERGQLGKTVEGE